MKFLKILYISLYLINKIIIDLNIKKRENYDLNKKSFIKLIMFSQIKQPFF